MNNKQRKPQMFKMIHATVNEDWLNNQKVTRNDFLESIEGLGCKLVLEKKTIHLECDFNLFLDVLNKFPDEKEELQATADIDEQSFETAAPYDHMIMDSYLWEYMSIIYGNEIELEENKHGLSVVEGESDHELVTIIFKPLLGRKPAISNVRENIYEMKDYISSLACVVSSSIVVESVRNVNLTAAQFCDLANYFENKYADLILKMVHDTIRLIGPPETCEEIKRRLKRLRKTKGPCNVASILKPATTGDLKLHSNPANDHKLIPEVEPAGLMEVHTIEPVVVMSERDCNRLKVKEYEEHDDDDDDDDDGGDGDVDHVDDNDEPDVHLDDDEKENTNEKLNNDGLEASYDVDDDDDDVENDYNQLKYLDDISWIAEEETDGEQVDKKITLDDDDVPIATRTFNEDGVHRRNHPEARPRITANSIRPSRYSWEINFNDEPVDVTETRYLDKNGSAGKEPRKRFPDIAFVKDKLPVINSKGLMNLMKPPGQFKVESSRFREVRGQLDQSRSTSREEMLKLSRVHDQ